MTISPESVSAASQARVNNDREIAVMKKAHDIEQEQAQALVNLVKQAAPMPPHVGSVLNVVA
jgi:hypothetical protein